MPGDATMKRAIELLAVLARRIDSSKEPFPQAVESATLSSTVWLTPFAISNKGNDMQVMILAASFGTRMSEESAVGRKPMAQIPGAVCGSLKYASRQQP